MGAGRQQNPLLYPRCLSVQPQGVTLLNCQQFDGCTKQDVKLEQRPNKRSAAKPASCPGLVGWHQAPAHPCCPGDQQRRNTAVT